MGVKLLIGMILFKQGRDPYSIFNNSLLADLVLMRILLPPTETISPGKASYLVSFYGLSIFSSSYSFYFSGL